MRIIRRVGDNFSYLHQYSTINSWIFKLKKIIGSKKGLIPNRWTLRAATCIKISVATRPPTPPLCYISRHPNTSSHVLDSNQLGVISPVLNSTSFLPPRWDSSTPASHSSAFLCTYKRVQTGLGAPPHRISARKPVTWVDTIRLSVGTFWNFVSFLAAGTLTHAHPKIKTRSDDPNSSRITGGEKMAFDIGQKSHDMRWMPTQVSIYSSTQVSPLSIPPIDEVAHTPQRITVRPC